MNMTLSKRGDYVMRSAIALARAFDSGAPRKIREVVADTELPRTFASQILADLVRAGLAVSKAGRDGGYRLSRRPEDISVLEVVEAAEGPLRAERCALGDGPCRWETVCPLHETWVEATARLNSLLAATSLAEVAARDAAMAAGRYPTPADSHRTHAVTVEVADAVQVELAAADVASALRRGDVERQPLAAAPTRRGSARARLEAPGTPLEVEEWSLEDRPRRARAGASHHALTWRLGGTRSSYEFEGELSVHPVDEERSEVRVSGSWHHHGVGEKPPASAVEATARRTMRQFLRRLAQDLEEGPSEPPARGAPAPPATRRRRAGARTA